MPRPLLGLLLIPGCGKGTGTPTGNFSAFQDSVPPCVF